MHYLTVLWHTLQTKNKLELAVLKHLHEVFDRTLFYKTDLAKIKRTLGQNIQGFNAEYPRCTKIEPIFWQPIAGTGNDWVMDLPFAKVWFYAEKL